MIDDSQRLVHLHGYNGMRIDPQTITLMLPMPNTRGFMMGGKTYFAKLMLETQAGGRWTIPCWSFEEAEQLADSLASTAHERGNAPRRAASVTDLLPEKEPVDG